MKLFQTLFCLSLKTKSLLPVSLDLQHFQLVNCIGYRVACSVVYNCHCYVIGGCNFLTLLLTYKSFSKSFPNAPLNILQYTVFVVYSRLPQSYN